MSTLPIVLSAISHFHSKYHFPTPTTSRSVTCALEGAQHTFCRPSVSVKIFTPDHLTSLAAFDYKTSCSFVFLRTVWRIFIEFFSLLRFNKVANLRFDDFSWTPVGFDLHIRRSKTNQHAKGNFVSVSKNSNPLLCPVSLTLLYFKRLHYSSGFLLSSMKGGTPDSDNAVSYATALWDLRRRLTKVGIDPTGFGEHSGRQGGTTVVALAGASVEELML